MQPRGDVCFYILGTIVICVIFWTLSFMSYCRKAYDEGYKSGMKTSVRYKRMVDEYGW